MKKLIKITIFLITTCGITFTSYAAIPITTSQTNTSIAPMLQKALPGVVNIISWGETLNPNLSKPLHKNPQNKKNKDNDEEQESSQSTTPQKFEGFGSGVIIDTEHGFILTNAHLVKDTQMIMVTLSDGRRVRAKIIGFDVPSDIAVLQINAKHLTALTIGDSDKLKVGDFVATIGNPFGLQQTVTSGLISALERTNLGIEGYENFIQTDAPINPGNSGGALVNMQGELIGINTAILSASASGANIGIGFAIPVNMAKSVTEQLIKYGKVERGMVGVTVQNITPSLAEAMHLNITDGALISQILPNSPAAAAGFKVQDIILSLNNKPIHTAAQVSNSVSLLRVGSEISFTILRDGKHLTLKAKTIDLGQAKQLVIEKTKQLLSGLQLRNFNQLINNEQIKGVEIINVGDNSIAFSSGLQPGDIILSAANQEVHTIEALQKISIANPKRLLLKIKRPMAGNVFLVIEE